MSGAAIQCAAPLTAALRDRAGSPHRLRAEDQLASTQQRLDALEGESERQLAQAQERAQIAEAREMQLRHRVKALEAQLQELEDELDVERGKVRRGDRPAQPAGHELTAPTNPRSPAPTPPRRRRWRSCSARTRTLRTANGRQR